MIRWTLALLIGAFLWPAQAQVNTQSLEALAIQEGGRRKPFLVFAEESLLSMSGRRSVQMEGEKIPAMNAVVSLWVDPAGWEDKQILLVDHKPLKDAVGLDTSRKHFSYMELASSEEMRRLLTEAAAARGAGRNVRLEGLLKEVADVGMRLAVFESLANGSGYTVVAAENTGGNWLTISAALQRHPELREKFQEFRQAFNSGNQERFDLASAALVSALNQIQPEQQPEAWRIQLEHNYQKIHPFRWAWILYALAGIILLASGLRHNPKAYAVCWGLVLGGFLLQVAGFVARVMISGRAPVTNMYESVIWVAFGTVLFALIFEGIYRCRYFMLGAIPVAVVSLILADSAPAILDKSITPLVPVLQSNFWLTTHVLTITLSYGAFALALGVGHIALFQVIRGTKPAPALYNYLYRTLQIGVLLLAIGTILGGVWANYSWGRFWDWDPKETWALIALLCYLIILHGRIAGSWGGFGLAVGAVLAFLSVLMAWYGVNFILGAGLHSYGFGTGGFPVVLGFVTAELALVGLAIVRKIQLGKRGTGKTVGV